MPSNTHVFRGKDFDGEKQFVCGSFNNTSEIRKKVSASVIDEDRCEVIDIKIGGKKKKTINPGKSQDIVATVKIVGETDPELEDNFFKFKVVVVDVPFKK